jgi:hypothetical protein
MSDPYTLYYLRQAEGRDHGGSYRGSSQKGDGLGSFLGGLFRRIFPLLKSGVKTLGTEALSSGIHLLRDVITGKPLKDSVRQRVTEAGTNLTAKAARKVESMVRSGYKRAKQKRMSHSAALVKRRRTYRRNRGEDIFD